MKLRFLFCCMAVAAFLLSVMVEPAFARKKEKKGVRVVQREDAYTKLFQGKRCETVKGLFTVHKTDGRVYFEVPLALLERGMLMGATIDEITDNSFGSVGEKPNNPIAVVFTRMDSVLSLSYMNLRYTTSDKLLKSRIEESTKPAALGSFGIKAYSPDSTAVVADVTDFFMSDIDVIGAFSPYAPVTGWGRRWIEKEFKKENSQFGKIRAYADNVSVQSSLSYQVSVRDKEYYYIYKMPFTVTMNRSFILLPEEEMHPRLADPRIGIFNGWRTEFTGTHRGIKSLPLTRRWRLEPSDEAKYLKGELVVPKRPIVFYVDDAFPANWRKYIKRGVEQWQDAFERIGFKDAIVAKDYPRDDPEFDPNNLKYSCVVYSPSAVANAMGPSWADPRTGEILNASVYLYHNLIKLVQDWRFVQTAPADPDARKMMLDEEVLGDCIRYVVSHEVGHCLGLMHNMSASAAIPTDSLRSPSFTQRYGTTYSIMDYARNNYVAQPGDKERGVKLTPPALGLYDFYAIKWLYTALPRSMSQKEETGILNGWIDEKAGDPVYRYGKQQVYVRLDPSSFEEDLGDDAIKSATYGVANLKYVLRHLNEWVGEEDPDYQFRESIYYEVAYQYVRYLNHVVFNVGGIYVNERYDGDPLPSYATVPKEKQKRALCFMLEQIQDLSWLDAPEFLKGFSIRNSIVPDVEAAIYKSLMERFPLMALCASKTDVKEEVYSQAEYMNDIYEYVWKSTRRGATLSELEKRLQLSFLSYLMDESGIQQKGLEGKPLALGADKYALRMPEVLKDRSKERYGELSSEVLGMFTNRKEVAWQRNELELSRTDKAGFGFFLWVTPPRERMEHLYFDVLKKTLSLLKEKVNTGSEGTRQHYKLMIFKIEQVVGR